MKWLGYLVLLALGVLATILDYRRYR